ncbi:response regulator [Alteromonas sp. IB21]|uniref:ATP-binding protein n=1 Tax=Alteromonas sp. IB21 TaxID=2779369 RepID=UPI0018E894D3|nr:ATP-binding protein [Alteromonas sp. IB21]MBJ2128663.1 response regulator [Alteromonas sp. IB21]
MEHITDIKTAQLQNCEDEAIHLIESVQSFGYVIAIDPESKKIQVVSENINDLFKVEITPNHTLITELIDIPSQEAPTFQTIYETVKGGNTRRAYQWKFAKNALWLDSWEKEGSGVVFDSNGLLVIELEPTPQLSYEAAQQWVPMDVDLRTLLPDVDGCKSINDVADAIAQVFKKYIGFSSVMVYQFDKDYCGEVIGEATAASSRSFKGLKFPASDIPSQARELYLKNRVRCVFDVEEKPIGLQPSVKESGRPEVDLSMSMVRSVSPVHITYLKNMGIRSSFSVSLVFEGKLWGLLACHNNEPKYIDQKKRLVCESLGHLYAWQLHTKGLHEKKEQFQIRQRKLNGIIHQLTSYHNPLEAITQKEAGLLDVANASGMAVITPFDKYLVGRTPPEKTLSRLLDKLVIANSEESIAINKLGNEVTDECDLNGIRGMYISCVSAKLGYYTVWFREPKDKTIRWAGEEAAKKDIGKSLTPRNSFDMYLQSVSDESVEWTEDDQLIIEGFDHLFIPYALSLKASLDKQISKLEELDKAKDQFLASISHELRSPLNSIVGWTDLALMDVKNVDRMTDALGVIKRAASTQAALINDILDLSRIISGTMKLSIHSLNIASSISEVAKSFEAGFASKNIKLSINCEDEYTQILGDNLRIKQVINNLLSNALKFTSKGGTVHVRGKREHSNYLFRVKDNGKGMTQEQIARVFERFYQGKNEHNKHGLGLGLSIVKSLVEMHGGEIYAESDGLNSGTTFFVSLPIAPLSLHDDIIETKNPEISDLTASLRLDGLRILVAEDEQDARDFIKLFLESNGARVNVAKNGLLAWKALNDMPEAFDLLLSDIGMPEMDGLGLVTKIRASEVAEIAKLNAVALTAYAYTSDRVKALKAGFNNYVSKPVDGEELLTILEMYLPVNVH